MSTSRKWIGVALLVSTLASAQAFAQKGPGKGGPGPMGKGKKGGPPPAELLEKVMERVRMMRMWKMTEVLALDEATAAKLFPMLKAFDERARPIQQELQTTREELRKVAKKQVDEKAATALIDRMLAAHHKMQELEAEKITALRKLLTPTQQARLVLVLPKIDRMIRQAVRKAVQRQVRKQQDDFDDEDD